jgi:hypothetical protein
MITEIRNSIFKFKILGKIFLIVNILIFMNVYTSNSQGFDWQTSGRMPYTIPNLFIGINTGYTYNNHYGEFNLKEDFVECCQFTTGSGAGYNFGLIGEYWYDGYTAFSAGLDFSTVGGDFTVQSVLPTKEGDFITEYGFNSTINYLNLEFGAKRRIYDTHITYGFGLRFSAVISSNSNYTEQAISNNVPFEKRTMNNGSIQDLNTLLLSPVLLIGYDASLGTGYYASPNISLAYNLNSVIEDEPWRRLSISLGIRIFRNL